MKPEKMNKENQIYFWTGMGFFLLEIIGIILYGVFSNLNLSLEKIAVISLGFFVILAINIVAGVLIVKGAK